MSDPIIIVENLSKRYLIGHQGIQGDGLRHALENLVRAPLHWLKNRRRHRATVEEFWALRDVSFQLERGDVVGIVGRNGAGKSTLLKILSRITEPTRGRITLGGRVASLLEVGTGFHAELTGRENIYLNGAILGMSRAEIRRKFDEIVAFSEVEQFLDTPVKRYSSGMYVRLAFAVAAHLEPEILIVDEVLAVGDATFQKKCIGKMQDVSKGGRTVLFVSHNMAAVRALCTKALLLKRGEVEIYGDVDTVTKEYLAGEPARSLNFPIHRGDIELTTVKMLATDGDLPLSSLTFSENYLLKLRLRLPVPLRAAIIISIHNDDGLKVCSINSVEEGHDFFHLSGPWEFSVALPNLSLMPGNYRLSLHVCNQHTVFAYFESVYSFCIEPKCLPGAFWAYNQSHGVYRISHGMRASPILADDCDLPVPQHNGVCD
ncbi:MAG TPA: ABC transporter ATP-binding protein [Verrucomicrobiae bacterium]